MGPNLVVKCMGWQHLLYLWSLTNETEEFYPWLPITKYLPDFEGLLHYFDD